MNESIKPPGLVIASGMKAQYLAGELHKALNTKEQWLVKELEGSSLKLTLNPYLKRTFQDFCADRRIPMVDYARQAIIAAMQRDLEADIAEMVALDAQSREAA